MTPSTYSASHPRRLSPTDDIIDSVVAYRVKRRNMRLGRVSRGGDNEARETSAQSLSHCLSSPRHRRVARRFAEDRPQRKRNERQPHRSGERDQRVTDERHPREQQSRLTEAMHQACGARSFCHLALPIFAERLRRVAGDPISGTRAEVVADSRYQHRRDCLLFASHQHDERHLRADRQQGRRQETPNEQARVSGKRL